MSCILRLGMRFTGTNLSHHTKINRSGHENNSWHVHVLRQAAPDICIPRRPFLAGQVAACGEPCTSSNIYSLLVWYRPHHLRDWPGISPLINCKFSNNPPPPHNLHPHTARNLPLHCRLRILSLAELGSFLSNDLSHKMRLVRQLRF